MSIALNHITLSYGSRTLLEEVSASFGQGQLTALIGLQNLSARFNAAMAIPAQGLCQIPTSSSQNKE